MDNQLKLERQRAREQKQLARLQKEKARPKHKMYVWYLLLILTLIYIIDENGGFTGTLIFTFVAPLFIMIGFVLCVGIGASSLLEGYRKNKEGQRDKVSIVRGWFLLSLSIIVVAVVVITLVILFNNHANTMGDTPVRMM